MMSPYLSFKLFYLAVLLLVLFVLVIGKNKKKKQEKSTIVTINEPEYANTMQGRSNDELLKLLHNDNKGKNVVDGNTEEGKKGAIVYCPYCNSEFLYTEKYHLVSTTIEAFKYDVDPEFIGKSFFMRKKIERFSDGSVIEHLPFLPPIIRTIGRERDDTANYVSEGRVSTYPLVCCPECFNLLEINEVEKMSVALDDDESLGKKPLARCPDFADLEQALKSNPKYEKLIRINLWRMLNHQQNCNFQKYKNNCYELIKILDRNSLEDRILLAELYRNLGEFERCLLVSSNANLIDSIITNECLKRNRGVIEIEGYWEKEEAKDERWKVCKNNHAYKNTDRCCPWCGESESVSRLEKDVTVSQMKLYVGVGGGRYVLTSNPKINGISDRIREIRVFYYSNIKFYYHLDGKNPNPLYTNKIKIGDGEILGRELTRKCDLFVKGFSKEIPLSVPYRRMIY